jgi:hypothetical protein
MQDASPSSTPESGFLCEYGLTPTVVAKYAQCSPVTYPFHIHPPITNPDIPSYPHPMLVGVPNPVLSRHLITCGHPVLRSP